MAANLRFEHVIVLMLENRSFDHLFGYLGIGDGLSGAAPRVNYEKVGDSTSQSYSTRKGGDYVAIGQGPSHSLKQVNEQLFGATHPVKDATAKLDGFVASFKTSLSYDLKRQPTMSELQQVMNGFDPVQLPVLSTLARSFVLCDRWFADVPGPTMPNRAFVHAATSQGYTYNADWKPEFTCKTLYDRINATDGKSWRVYYHDKNDVLELYPDLSKTPANNVLFESAFLADVDTDNLATYSFITPVFMGTPDQPVNSMHAPADVRPAEKLVADVYNALRAKPDVWKKTLFVVLFDEHGGYYDHVVPPPAVSPDDIAGRTDKDFLVPFAFDRLGLRVPAILISPWFKAGVDSTVYSHSTLPGSIIEAFDLKGGFLTKRDEKANRLTQKYLVRASTDVWRTDTPDLEVPVQPDAVDLLQRETLEGAANLDPHPELQNPLRVADIHDPVQARNFVRTQVTKRLEHHFASKAGGKAESKLRATHQRPGISVSPARVAELASKETDAAPTRRP
jgi:phospholipase C